MVVLIPPFCTYFGIKSAGRFAALILVIKVRKGIVGCAFWTNCSVCCLVMSRENLWRSSDWEVTHSKTGFSTPPHTDSMCSTVQFVHNNAVRNSELSLFLSTSLFDILVCGCDIPSVGVNVIDDDDLRRQ